MIMDLLSEFPVDASRTFVAGDRPSGIEAARTAGLPGYLFTGKSLRELVLPLLPAG
ncbi:HAD hydrolase-like protein [Bradyrhizobium sp. 44]|uniref:HAD hydrolase-like protein n=1 Tax=Bradyrhizobium sp. 44 TaxID=2782675 RepID=UPI001FFA8EFB|nr:HAD hydrolase-like protein [Bradyrhizobium sp. 44]